MILQTGGRALGATSTRSRPSSRARRKASPVDVEPTLLSSWSIRKTGEILICSLWRKLVEMAGHSCVRDIVPRARHTSRDGRGETPELWTRSNGSKFAALAVAHRRLDFRGTNP